MFKSKNTYGDFLSSDEKIATNILADRLSMLERAGLISKHSHPDSKVKVLYKLTAKGIDLLPILVEVVIWSEKHEKVSALATEFAKAVKKDREGFIKQTRESLKK